MVKLVVVIIKSQFQVFNSRQDLIDWARNVAFSLGFVIVIKRSRRDSHGDPCEVVLQCDCGGIHKGNNTSSKHTGTRKTNCPFGLVGNHLGNDCWTLTVNCEAHNHDFALHLEGHAYARRLSQTEAQLVEDLSANNVKPRDILSTIKKQYPDNVSTKKTVYNQCQKLRLKKNAGRTPMQVVMSFLQEEGYVFYDRANDSTNELEDLFFAHPRSLEIWRAFPHVLLMDVTYKTTMFETPLLQIVGVTSTNKTFCVAFVFMHKEKISNYTWALKCLLSLMDKCLHPRVIVTDRDLALMRACNNVFPGAKRLLCRWHIYQSIMRHCRPAITDNDVWGSFYNAWMAIIASESDETYLSNFAQLEAVLLSYPGTLEYIINKKVDRFNNYYSWD